MVQSPACFHINWSGKFYNPRFHPRYFSGPWQLIRPIKYCAAGSSDAYIVILGVSATWFPDICVASCCNTPTAPFLPSQSHLALAPTLRLAASGLAPSARRIDLETSPYLFSFSFALTLLLAPHRRVDSNHLIVPLPTSNVSVHQSFLSHFSLCSSVSALYLPLSSNSCRQSLYFVPKSIRCTLLLKTSSHVSSVSSSIALPSISFRASTRAATNVNGRLRYLESFVSNTYALILCVASRLYFFLYFVHPFT